MNDTKEELISKLDLNSYLEEFKALLQEIRRFFTRRF